MCTVCSFKALAYSAEAAMDELVALVTIVSLIVFTLVSVTLYFTKVHGKKAEEIHTGRLFLAAVGITLLLLVVLGLGIISIFQ